MERYKTDEAKNSLVLCCWWCNWRNRVGGSGI